MPSRTSPHRPPPSLAQCLTLGLLHGPTELLPISSSGHTTLLPWLLGWDYGDQDPERRKDLEVALHAGAAAGLLLVARAELPGRLNPRYMRVVAAAAGPPAMAGLVLKRQIERGLGTPSTIAAGLIGGGLAMLLADRSPEAREASEAGVADGLWLGLAQACALAPGVSRSGATLTAARLRGFTRAAAAQLSHDVGLPVLAGAAGLEAVGVARERLEPQWRLALAAAAAAAFVSTLLAARIIAPDRGRRLRGWAGYRLGLGALVLVRLLKRPGGRP